MTLPRDVGLSREELLDGFEARFGMEIGEHRGHRRDITVENIGKAQDQVLKTLASKRGGAGGGRAYIYLTTRMIHFTVFTN
jgi:hypothetical protein